MKNEDIQVISDLFEKHLQVIDLALYIVGGVFALATAVLVVYIRNIRKDINNKIHTEIETKIAQQLDEEAMKAKIEVEVNKKIELYSLCIQEVVESEKNKDDL